MDAVKMLLWGITGVAVFLSISVAVDNYYYGVPLVSVWNLVHYNVFAPKGSELYGVEEWPYYFINLFLNFNVVFVLSLIALPVLKITSSAPLAYPQYGPSPPRSSFL